jgi:methionyl-tRNA formyltransferase
VAVIAFAGCKTTTKETIEQLYKDGYRVDYLITLTPEQGERHQVAGYMDLRAFAADMGIKVIVPSTYSLQAVRDQELILPLNIDCLLVIGWQRLIPDWLLKSLSVGAFGMHGSSEPLPKGRGRSPMNWSLIEGKPRFLTHLFKYDVGVDSGEIVAVQEFDINEFDTAETLHFKNRIAMNRLLKVHLPRLLDRTATLTPQPTDVEPTYYPKRTAEDGIIMWEKPAREIYNLVRAVTHPFPGAFTFAGDAKVLVWRAQPFDNKLRYPEAHPGQVVEVFYNGQFVVRAGDSSLLVLEYEVVPTRKIQCGDILAGSGGTANA